MPIDTEGDVQAGAVILPATDRGDFDDLPGYGKPIPDHGDDELWWVKSYLAREGLSTEALLPPELQLRREIERLPDTVGSAPSEKVVREIVSDLNRRIADCLRFPSGLPVPIHKVDAEEMVEVWKLERARRREEARTALRQVSRAIAAAGAGGPVYSVTGADGTRQQRPAMLFTNGVAALHDGDMPQRPDTLTLVRYGAAESVSFGDV